MNKHNKPVLFDEAAFPETEDASDDVREWQAQKVRTGLKAADEGRFASTEAVKAVIQKYIPDA
jgi:predicted transcriptional regulator